jgi:hypothetical protein
VSDYPVQQAKVILGRDWELASEGVFNQHRVLQESPSDVGTAEDGAPYLYDNPIDLLC